jgi:hypothetical protein
LAARDAVQLARAKLELAELELAHYEKLADATAERLRKAVKVANRRKVRRDPSTSL